VKEQVLDIALALQSINGKIDGLTKQLDIAHKEIVVLKDRLAVYETPKDSHNSSIPSSKESIKAQVDKSNKLLITRSLREKSNKSTGGQIGHTGVTLEMATEPDFIEQHVPDFCTNCGNNLSQIEGSVVGIRQSVDVPLPIQAVVTEHQVIAKKCSCGHCCEANFPKHVRSNISYGPNIRAIVTYFSCSQYIPYKRLTEILHNCFGVKMSQGTVDNILQDMEQKSQPAYDEIRARLEESKVVGADETGVNINGELHWGWTFQSENLTYVFNDKSRGKVAIDKHFTYGLPNTILVSDRHASYFNMDVVGHQICLAHILRELTYLTELYANQTWSSDLAKLIRDAIHERKTVLWENIDRNTILDRLKKILIASTNILHIKIIAIQKSLIKHKDHVFKFLFHPQVPYDNNGSERVVRSFKIKQKISGSYRGADAKGANAFCHIHSITQTAKKNNQNPFLAILAVANNF
jgi:transposase